MHMHACRTKKCLKLSAYCEPLLFQLSDTIADRKGIGNASIKGNKKITWFWDKATKMLSGTSKLLLNMRKSERERSSIMIFMHIVKWFMRWFVSMEWIYGMGWASVWNYLVKSSLNDLCDQPSFWEEAPLAWPMSFGYWIARGCAQIPCFVQSSCTCVWYQKGRSSWCWARCCWTTSSLVSKTIFPPSLLPPFPLILGMPYVEFF